MPLNLFDPALDLRVTSGRLPHWYQPEVTYFLTWRTNDSFPSDIADLWHRRRDDWLLRHGIHPNLPRWQDRLRDLPVTRQDEYHNTFSNEFLEHLDRGRGDCVLKRPDLAALVAENLQYFNGDRYMLADFIVMPNHVHTLVCLLGRTDVEEQCYSWKKYTATQINRALGRQGRFWHEESFDHLVRTPAHFEHFRRYIADNPKKAGLRSCEYLHWSKG